MAERYDDNEDDDDSSAKEIKFENNQEPEEEYEFNNAFKYEKKDIDINDISGSSQTFKS